MIDELEVNIVPVLLGKGLRLFENLEDQQIERERIAVQAYRDFTYLKFRVVK